MHVNYPPIMFYIIKAQWLEFTHELTTLRLFERTVFSQALCIRLNVQFDKFYEEMNEKGLIVAQKSRNDSKQPGKAEFNGFANIPFNADEREAFTSWFDGEKDVFTPLVSLFENGYKISFSPDNDRKCVICTVTGTATKGHNSGYAMVSRAPDWHSALAVAIFKHFELAHEDWTPYTQQSATDVWG